MNRSLFLHVIERLEGLIGKLPATIQKPILSELTPMKQLFLQHRSPRFVITGSSNTPLLQLMSALFPGSVPDGLSDNAHRKDHWRDFRIEERGTISIFDARTPHSEDAILNELGKTPGDVIFFIEDEGRKRMRKEPIENLLNTMEQNRRGGTDAAVVGIIYATSLTGEQDETGTELAARTSRLQTALESQLKDRAPLLRIFAVRETGESDHADPVISAIAQQLPNEARIEMARVFRHRSTQREIGQLLVKSTSAICTAIGAQPIPLADLPILTTLQLVMVSGIMYLSGRERSLRAATEFVAALGANVGAGMLLREGARTILKFLPGWGNVVCGMIAGAGTYAIGQAAIAYFLEGLSLKEARQTYLTSRKRSGRRLSLDSPTSKKRRGSDGVKRSSRLRLRG